MRTHTGEVLVLPVILHFENGLSLLPNFINNSLQRSQGEHVQLLGVVAWYMGTYKSSLGNAVGIYKSSLGNGVGTSGDPLIGSTSPHPHSYKDSFQYT